MDRNFSFNDENIKKSLISLKYLAYIMIGIVITLGYIFVTYQGIKFMEDINVKKVNIIMWMIVFYITSGLVIWGIVDVILLLSNIEKNNIFTYENADIIKRIDRKLLVTLFFSIIINIVFVLANNHNIILLSIWVLFIGFILIGHVLVKPIQLLVEKSAEMQIEMDLTI